MKSCPLVIDRSGWRIETKSCLGLNFIQFVDTLCFCFRCEGGLCSSSGGDAWTVSGLPASALQERLLLLLQATSQTRCVPLHPVGLHQTPEPRWDDHRPLGQRRCFCSTFSDTLLIHHWEHSSLKKKLLNYWCLCFIRTLLCCVQMKRSSRAAWWRLKQTLEKRRGWESALISVACFSTARSSSVSSCCSSVSS